MVQRMFQDSAGSLPAVLAGQPVGLVKRMVGNTDVLQATTLSKPTLARWPKGGARSIFYFNDFAQLAVGELAAGVNDARGLMITGSQSGIIVSVAGRGVIGGKPYLDLRYAGTPSNSSVVFFNLSSGNSNTVTLPTPQPAATVISGAVQLLAGALPAADLVRTFCNFYEAGGASVNGTATILPVTNQLSSFAHSVLIPAGVERVQNRGLYLRLEAGKPAFDFTLRVVGMQVEYGSTASGFQLTRGLNDITEAEVEDCWHLYNDGGDSLPIVLPAGSYGLAFVDHLGSVTVQSLASDGSTPINTLRSLRQVDVVLRPGAFNSEETKMLRHYWEGLYK